MDGIDINNRQRTEQYFQRENRFLYVRKQDLSDPSIWTLIPKTYLFMYRWNIFEDLFLNFFILLFQIPSVPGHVGILAQDWLKKLFQIPFSPKLLAKLSSYCEGLVFTVDRAIERTSFPKN